MLKKGSSRLSFFPLSVNCFVFSWAVRMPKFSSWNDEQLFCFNFLVMHSLQLIFPENWVRWSKKKVYPEPKILWVASAWSESKLLRNMIWWIRVATSLFWAKFYIRNFYLWKLQNKKFLDDEKYLPEPYAWSLQRNNPFYMLLVPFWALSNFVTFVSCFSYCHDRESRTHHLHMLKLSHRKDSISIPTTLLCSIFHTVSPKILSNKGMRYVLKKKEKRAHEGPWKKMMDTWRSMQK